MPATAGPPDGRKRVALVIVTHNRPDLLDRLLASVRLMSVQPEAIVVVDNASTPPVAAVVARHQTPATPIRLLRLEQNRGGAGGFAAGIEHALGLGVDWCWLMDDDVEILPRGLEEMLGFADRFRCFHGRRLDPEGQPFHWQPRFNNWLGLPLPILGNPFKGSDHFITNCGCFEGMFIHRSVIEAIGVPDAQFFITWDDAVFGWLASFVTPVAGIDRFVLRRIRPQRQISLGIRHLSDSSDFSRFYVMRNRAVVKSYFAAQGLFQPLGFALGTLLTLAKELLRLVAVEHTLRGVSSLFAGMREARRLERTLSRRPTIRTQETQGRSMPKPGQNEAYTRAVPRIRSVRRQNAE